ncbi:hypothetical protein [Bacillus sp. FJAT-27225]|uniref:hypothetical protein n=1 Tax=Bacillus sp. FJAT-27225 TaxID=1743144 RepID=UPI000980DE5B|nr:hypothetical protein [Bacillus sp. FJAT-27225]
MSASVLTGCNDAEEVKPPPENAPAENQVTTQPKEQAVNQMDINFVSFDLEVDNQNSKGAIEISYEN